MRGKLVIIGCVLGVVGLAACCPPLGLRRITGSRNLVTEIYDISGFDKVDVSWGFHVDVTQGETFEVSLRVDDNVLPDVEVVKKGSTLHIGFKRGRVLSVGRATLEATVTMPVLTGLDLGGGSHGKITGFRSGSEFVLDVSGGSHLDGEIEAGDATFDCSGGGHVTLSGSADDLVLNASGGSHVNLGSFSVDDARIKASGGSNVTVNAGGRLDAEASGGSGVYYKGSPSLGNINTSGGSWVKPR